MNKDYYYLVASLPYLLFGDEPPISSPKFLEECGKWVPPVQLRRILSAKLQDDEIKGEDAEPVREWKMFNLELKKELARVR